MKNIGKNASMRIAIIGRTEILYSTIQKLFDYGHIIPLIITAKEAPEYQKSREDFRKVANIINAEFISTADICSNNSIKLIERNLPLDLGVSMNYPGIIPQRIIDYFKNGILNAHGGDLPLYRGNACQAWAIINGEKKIGFCIHKMLGGELDSGDIVERGYFPLDLNTRIGDYHNWTQTSVPKLFLFAVNKLQDQPDFILEKQSKNKKEILRCYPRRPKDGRIDWSQSNLDILRLINASSEPYSGAFCELEGKKCVIWRAQFYEDNEKYCAIPGQVASILENGEITVITGNGKLLIKEIQIEGKRMVPSYFVKSTRQRFE
jgi:methionyl-tRNA formyltransferase